ncbi:MAG: hypothetical protein A2V70_02675 [Planctomycetes bacterium RBG_13_63_9]|nr:MAG: hypothetical protein A2V70_02675 [Planctomycetes bacterium RBG_13_63_9]
MIRRLIHIPIVHTSEELGSLSDAVKACYSKAFGPRTWSRREQVVAELWKHIRESIEALHLDEEHVRIYQDGLPVCGFEEKIVRELAEAGSCNHQLIVELLDRGATLEGTEEPQLLMEEYEMQKQCMENRAVSDQGREERTRQAEHLLKARDAYIAKRIDATLKPGETGLVFLGASHRLHALQSTDIQVSPLGDESNEAVRRPGT